MKKPALVLCVVTVAQNPPVHYDTIYSEILQEKRLLQIYFPKNYQNATAEKCDAIYVLDGGVEYIIDIDSS